MEKNIFITRMLSYESLNFLINKCALNNIDILIDVNDYNNFATSNIIKNNIIILNKLRDYNDEIIKNVCMNERKRLKVNKLDLPTLGTTSAHKYMNMNLVITTDPYNFALENFDNLLKDIGDFNVKRSYNIYENKKKENIRMINKYEKALVNDSTHMSKLDKMKNINEEKDNLTATFKFPDWAQINSNEHIERYAKNTNIVVEFIRKKLHIDMINIDDIIDMDNEILLLLLCGVGIYYPQNKLFSEKYNKIVLYLADDNKLAYFITNKSIAYGVNYPFNRIFITNDINPQINLNTLFQLMGRAGRVGISWKADIIMDFQILKKIERYIQGQETTDDELNNMLKISEIIDDENIIIFNNKFDAFYKSINDARNITTNEENVMRRKIYKKHREYIEENSYKSIDAF